MEAGTGAEEIGRDFGGIEGLGVSTFTRLAGGIVEGITRSTSSGCAASSCIEFGTQHVVCVGANGRPFDARYCDNPGTTLDGCHAILCSILRQ